MYATNYRFYRVLVFTYIHKLSSNRCRFLLVHWSRWFLPGSSLQLLPLSLSFNWLWILQFKVKVFHIGVHSPNIKVSSYLGSETWVSAWGGLAENYHIPWWHTYFSFTKEISRQTFYFHLLVAVTIIIPNCYHPCLPVEWTGTHQNIIISINIIRCCLHLMIMVITRITEQCSNKHL